METLTETSPISLRDRWLYGLLFAVVALFYLPTAQHGFLDDETIILFQKSLPGSVSELLTRSFEPHFPGLPYFRPVPHFTYLAQAMRDQNSAAEFHVLNAILIGVTACLVFGLFRAPALSISTLWAWLGGLLVAVHPATSSTVIPIVGRETLMGGLFTIAALNCQLHGGRWKKFAPLMLGLGLLSKEQCIIIPVLFFAADWLQSRSVDADTLKYSWRKIAIISCLTSMLVVTGYLVFRWTLFEGGEFQFRVLHDPAAFGHSLRFLIQTVFAPFVELKYEPPVSAWASAPRFAIGLLIFTALVIFTFRTCGLRTVGFFWFLWIVLSVLPTANILEQQAEFSERYVVLAVVACTGWVAALVTRTRRRGRRIASAGVACILIAGSGWVSFERGQYFHSQYRFAKQWVKTNPRFIEAQMSIGHELFLLGRLDRAAEHYQIGGAMEHPAATTCLIWAGKLALARQQPEMALDILQSIPADELFAQLYCAVAEWQGGRQAAAVSRLRRLLQRNASFHPARFLLARWTDSVAELTPAKSAAVLDLRFTTTGDADLRALSDFAQLRSVYLSHTAVSSAGMNVLQALPALEQVALHGTTIDDTGVRFLRQIVRLRALGLGNTRITDACVDDLTALPDLRYLDVRYTRLSSRALRRIREELPLCRVIFEPIPSDEIVE